MGMVGKAMSGQDNWRKMLQEKRLEHQLEIQSRQIETVLSQHQVSGHVAGGYVQPRTIRFDLASHLETGLERLRHIKQDLLSALGAADGELVPHSDGWQLHVSRPEEPPVSLLNLLAMLPDCAPLTVIMGLDEDGRPVLVELSDDDLAHIFIAGDSGSGKSALIRTIALSLALTHRQSQLQLAIIDGSTGGKFEAYTSLEPLSYLPHMLAPVAYDQEEYRDLLAFLVGECIYRQEQQMNSPHIVILIDEAVQLFSQPTEKDNLGEQISQLVQRGPAVGMHLVLTSSTPESEKLSNTMRLNLPVRLVGKLSDAQKATAAAGVSGTQAEYLLGKGDFLAVVDRQIAHFQAAYVGDYDLHLTLETLQRSRPQPLLAQPLGIEQMTISTPEHHKVQTHSFAKTAAGIQVIDLDQVA